MESLKRITPTPILNVAKNTYDAIRRLPKVPDAYLHPWRRKSRQRMYEMKDIHHSERCFIIGNGPSLKNTDLSKLKDERTFGMNRIYLMFPELGFTTTYFASINDLVIEQCAEDIAALPMPKFIAWHSNRHFQRFPDDMVFLYTTYTGPQFAYDMTRRPKALADSTLWIAMSASQSWGCWPTKTPTWLRRFGAPCTVSRISYCSMPSHCVFFWSPSRLTSW